MRLRLFLIVSLLCLPAWVGAEDDPAMRRSSIKDKDLQGFAKHVTAFFEAHENPNLRDQIDSLDELDDAMAKSSKRAKLSGSPLEFPGDWELVFEYAKGEEKTYKSKAGKGFFLDNFTDPYEKQPISYLLSLPGDYLKGDDLHGVVLALKPVMNLSGDDLEERVTEVATAMYGELIKDTIVMIPLGPMSGKGRKAEVTEVTASWMTYDGLYTLLTSMRTLFERVQYDRARLVLDGWGDASGDSLRLASRAPQWFAGCLVRSGALPEKGDVLYSNLRPSPIAYVSANGGEGGADKTALDELGATVIADSGTSMEPGDEARGKIADWVRGCRRDLVPMEIDHLIDAVEYQSVYWVKASRVNRRATAKPDDEDFPRIKATADRAKNKITIETTNVLDGIWVYLSDALVDMSKPVTIEVNGTEKVNRMFERDLRTALENRFYNNSGDFGVYMAQVLIDDIG